MKKLKEKIITRSYGELKNANPNCQYTPIWSMDFSVSIDEWVGGQKYFLNETRVGFLNKKILAIGTLEDLKEKFEAITNEWFIHKLEVNGFN